MTETEPWQGEVRWTLETLSGEAMDAGKHAVSAKPLATTALPRLDFSSLVGPHNARRVVFVAELWQAGACLRRMVAPFVPDKHLELAAPGLDVSIEQAGEQLSIRLQADSLARFVELSLEGADVIFSDNYFDLPAGRTVSITCPMPEGWDIAKAKQGLKIRSLKDA